MASPQDEFAGLWLRETLRNEVHVKRPIEILQDLDFKAQGFSNFPPDKIPYLRKLFTTFLQGRVIVSYYKYVLIALLAVFTALHAIEKRRCKKRWQETVSSRGDIGRPSTSDSGEEGNDTVTTASTSSSSSFSIGTPSGRMKDANIDIETLPLLGLQPGSERVGLFVRVNRLFKEFLEYQPQNIPVVNRVLPSNATSLFITFWFAINFFFHFYQLPSISEYSFCFAARGGDIFIANLPLLYLLAAKNQPIKLLTGCSYEALNIFHRRVGEWMCLEAFVHSVGMLLWRFVLEPSWLRPQTGAWAYLSHPQIYYGIGAFISYELLYFTSLGSFRQRWYELFLASHVLLQILALGFLYRHFYTARPYVFTAVTIFLLDRIIWRLGLKSATVDADLQVLPDGETVRLSARWNAPPRSTPWHSWLRPRQDIRHGWKPTDHVFLTVPALGRLQAHPFTIASPAPALDRPPEQISMDLLIRAHGGSTADLLRHAGRGRARAGVRVRLDGPYGSSRALDVLRAADNACLVAGGSGIAVTLPLAWALLLDPRCGGGDRRFVGTGRRVRMLWVVHSEEHRRWVPEEHLGRLLAAGLELVVPAPTCTGGRPDVGGIIESWVEGLSPGRESAVVVSGPDGLNRMARNTCARLIGRGDNIHLAVEKFGW